MKFTLLLALACLPTLTWAAAIDVTNNVISLQCDLAGFTAARNTLSLTVESIVNPRDADRTQRLVHFTAGGLIYDDHYQYLLDRVVYDDNTQTYTVSLHGVKTRDATLELELLRADRQEFKVIGQNLPSSRLGKCVMSGSLATN